MQLDNLSIADLKEYCRQEILKYRRRLKQDTNYCLEIFRRAGEDGSETAFTALYELYQGLVYYWVSKHLALISLEMEAEDFVAAGMSRFFLALKNRSFREFTSISGVVQYWRKCVHSVVMAEIRKKQVSTTALDRLDEAGTSQELDRGIRRAEIWQRIEALLPDKKLLLLARLVILQDLKPRQIVELYSNLWPAANDVRVDRQRMKRILEADSALRRLLEVDDASE